ncbi:hypothetical protein HHK36_027072 [Tetracentron sinense]|uniref:DDE Tnp4 domain-containing protein n=1 Tax=Tetracentron sinense TaxID=13715 RepID=A0A834YGZ0_TETSI|nr:hypothetical protein HHK36_027072 [Tetracentron sinense]
MMQYQVFSDNSYEISQLWSDSANEIVAREIEDSKPTKDCVGAINGTHVRASVPIDLQARFRGRKEETTQNVLVVISFDLKFMYVLASWEGSAHDSCILDDALSRPNGLRIPEGKYFLGEGRV